jgi:hypothetical protein
MAAFRLISLVLCLASVPLLGAAEYLMKRS